MVLNFSLLEDHCDQRAENRLRRDKVRIEGQLVSVTGIQVRQCVPAPGCWHRKPETWLYYGSSLKGVFPDGLVMGCLQQASKMTLA